MGDTCGVLWRFSNKKEGWGDGGCRVCTLASRLVPFLCVGSPCSSSGRVASLKQLSRVRFYQYCHRRSRAPFCSGSIVLPLFRREMRNLTDSLNLFKVLCHFKMFNLYKIGTAIIDSTVLFEEISVNLSLQPLFLFGLVCYRLLLQFSHFSLEYVIVISALVISEEIIHRTSG